MGCGQSKSAAVIALGQAASADKPLDPKDKHCQEALNQNAQPILTKPGLYRPDSGTTASVSAVALRNTSAASQRSADSGIGSAKSSSDAKALFEKPSFLQAKPRERVDSSKILASLREEGLIDAPQTKTGISGVCFEISLDELQPHAHSRRPPARLQRLDKAKEMELTREKIRIKLERAQRIRKKREQQRLQQLKENDAKILNIATKLSHTGSSGVSQQAKNRSEYEAAVMKPKPSVLNIDELPVGAAVKAQN